MTNIKKIINEEINNIVQANDGGQVYNGIIKSLDHVNMVFDSIEMCIRDRTISIIKIGKRSVTKKDINPILQRIMTLKI